MHPIELIQFSMALVHLSECIPKTFISLRLCPVAVDKEKLYRSLYALPDPIRRAFCSCSALHMGDKGLISFRACVCEENNCSFSLEFSESDEFTLLPVWPYPHPWTGLVQPCAALHLTSNSISLAIHHSLVDARILFGIARALVLNDFSQLPTHAIEFEINLPRPPPINTEHEEICGLTIGSPPSLLLGWVSWFFPPLLPFLMTHLIPPMEGITLTLPPLPKHGVPEGVTTNDWHSALIWRSYCIARALPTDTISQLVLAVDARRDLDPQSQTLGNVVLYAVAEAPVCDLLQENILLTATRVRKAVSLVRGKGAHCQSEFIASLEIRSLLRTPFQGAVMGPHVGISTWAGFWPESTDSIHVNGPAVDGISLILAKDRAVCGIRSSQSETFKKAWNDMSCL